MVRPLVAFALLAAACSSSPDPIDAADLDAATRLEDASPASDGGDRADAALEAAPADMGAPDVGAPPAGEPVWVGVGAFGLMGSTRDGVDWWQTGPSGSGNPHTPDLLRGVAWNDGVFLAVGGHQNSLILRSTDGVTWTDSGSSDPGPWLGGVAGQGDTWVAAGGTSIVRSVDEGYTWATVSARELPGGLRAVGAGPDGTWVVGGDGGTIAVSNDDGLTWTERSVDPDNAAGFNGVAFHAGRWLLAGSGWAGDHSEYTCYISEDAVTFEPCPFDYGSVSSVGVHDGAFHVFSAGTRWRSADGLAWKSAPSNVLQAAYGGPDGGWVAKRYGATFAGADLDDLAPTDYSTGFRAFAVGYVP